MSTADACPSCGRPAIGRAFGRLSTYVRCSLGHVWADELAAAESAVISERARA